MRMADPLGQQPDVTPGKPGAKQAPLLTIAPRLPVHLPRRRLHPKGVSLAWRRKRPRVVNLDSAHVIAPPASKGGWTDDLAANTNWRTARTDGWLAFAVLTTERKAA